MVHLFLARLSDSILHNKFTHTELCDCMSTITYTKCNAPIWHVTIDRFDLQNWSLNTWYIIISTQTFVTCCWLDTLKCVYSFTINDVCVLLFYPCCSAVQSRWKLNLCNTVILVEYDKFIGCIQHTSPFNLLFLSLYSTYISDSQMDSHTLKIVDLHAWFDQNIKKQNKKYRCSFSQKNSEEKDIRGCSQ